MVTVPDEPGRMTVRGGWKVARLLSAEHWDVLV